MCRRSLEAVQRELASAQVLIVGPGIGRSEATQEFVMELLYQATVPVVLDADGLYALSHDLSVLKKTKAPCVLTPHVGEMSRLTGLSAESILGNMLETASRFSREQDVITVLKDARTIVASPSGHTYINTTGCSALAKAGSGDVLTGLIAAFVAQGVDVPQAAKLGVYIHGRAGERAAESRSEYGVVASDVADSLPLVLAELLRV